MAATTEGWVDVFRLRDRLVSDCEEFTRRSITVRVPRISEVVDRELADGLLWPESFIQLNPSFRPGATIDELLDEGVLREAKRAIFRRGKSEGLAGSAGSTLGVQPPHASDRVPTLGRLATGS